MIFFVNTDSSQNRKGDKKGFFKLPKCPVFQCIKKALKRLRISHCICYLLSSFKDAKSTVETNNSLEKPVWPFLKQGLKLCWLQQRAGKGEFKNRFGLYSFENCPFFSIHRTATPRAFPSSLFYLRRGRQVIELCKRCCCWGRGLASYPRSMAFECVYFGDHITTDYIMYYTS